MTNDVEIFHPSNQLTDRVRLDGGLTLEELLDRADAVVARTVCQWHAGIVEEVSFMMRAWMGRAVTARMLEPIAASFSSIVRDIADNAEALGYPNIRQAAGELLTALARVDTEAEGGDDGSLRGQAEAVTAGFARLRMMYRL